jgi:protein-tyrosine phosphatase
MTQEAPPHRHLSWEGCLNVRDLGGLPTADGRATAWKAVIRADLLGRLTAAGKQVLLDYGVQTVIDLRPAKEIAGQPSAFTPESGEVHYHCRPMEHYYPHVSAEINQAQNRAEVYGLILHHYPDLTADVMRTILNAPPGGVVIHCHSGMDRTGTIAAMLLALAGVDADLIAADYAQSQLNLKPMFDGYAAEMGDEAQNNFWMRPTAGPEMMQRLLTYLNENYGGAVGYLTAAGLSSGEIEGLRGRLRPFANSAN